jgi:hypothetical protein
MLDIKILKIEEFKNGFERLRNAKLELTGTQDIFDYRKSKIYISKTNPLTIKPCTFYALNKNIEFQKTLRDSLFKQHKIELFDLPGIMYLEISNKKIGLVPPFVEIYNEENNKIVKSLQDGIHRYLLAIEQGIQPQTIYIDNSNCKIKYLPYAYPNSWHKVKIGDSVPSVKKKYRYSEPYSYMRPLSSIFDKKLINEWADYNKR